jgi:hypothetical protein
MSISSPRFKKKPLVLITFVIIAVVLVPASTASLGNVNVWEEDFEVSPPQIDCAINIGDTRILGYPVNIDVSLSVGGGMAENLIFSDDFENYAVGSFPGQWTLVFNGMGNQYQKVVDTTSDSPTKSLRMQGEKNWAADAVRFFQSDADKIGFEVSVRVSQNNGKTEDDVKVGLWKRLDWGTALWTDGIAFTDNGTIVARDVVAREGTGQVLQSYVPNQWYKIRFELDRQNRLISVWVDGELKGQNIKGSDKPYDFDGLAVSGRYTEIPVNYDDVKIFEGEMTSLTEDNYGIRGIYSAEMQHWNTTTSNWETVAFLQKETNITLTGEGFTQSYTYVPTSLGKYKVKVTLVTDYEVMTFAKQS